MPILNYTTKVPASRTIAEILQLLAGKGARSISQQYAGAGKCISIEFELMVGGLPVWFRLPASVDGIYGHMARKAPPRYRSREQAERVAWRILKDWCEAQIALVESNQAEIGQVFMAYAIGEDGRTTYTHFLEHQQKRLGAGGGK